jgi:hypothetical protein
MIEVYEEIEEIELQMMILEDKENNGDMRNKRFFLGELKLKINRLTEELNML